MTRRQLFSYQNTAWNYRYLLKLKLLWVALSLLPRNFDPSRGKRRLKIWNQQRIILARFLLFFSGCPEKCLYLRSGYDRIMMRCQSCFFMSRFIFRRVFSSYLCLSPLNLLWFWFRERLNNNHGLFFVLNLPDPNVAWTERSEENYFRQIGRNSIACGRYQFYSSVFLYLHSSSTHALKNSVSCILRWLRKIQRFPNRKNKMLKIVSWALRNFISFWRAVFASSSLALSCWLNLVS